ncbi:hypothetical protein [Synechococcus sp. PCC 7336]|uniref:acyltransferase n=1 Tax=Synechococcus sp. PCC 7336 TaxID=195250 RepID=UPI000348678A|nr:hypothetical protein [Synechococcus sp. PCC 7336]
MLKVLLTLLSWLLPWPLRRRLLCCGFGFEIHPTARIGLALVLPKRLEMAAGSSISHLTVCKNLDLVKLGASARIGRGNWITGFPSDNKNHFVRQSDRKPQLVLEDHAAITNRHIIDCTDAVRIGSFSTFAGFASQILTHSIDLAENRQSCAPINIGSYCFVGTNCVLLGGSQLPNYSVLGAKSLLNKSFETPYQLYGGTPATAVKELDPQLPYFTRERGFVD